MKKPRRHLDPERARLADTRTPWKAWGPYLSERQWGTVREDYSADGSAWESFPHDHARSRAYRWGEDGLGGLSDDQARLCLSVALWNGADPILKERLFGLTNAEGNHGEDVKELYWYLDGTPTHSYMKMLYRYPQRAYPYADLVRENARRGREAPEYEILDTGVFDGGRYFDVEIEHAKAGPEDLLLRVTAHNRGPEDATLHVLPQVVFRNTWSWRPGIARPSVERVAAGRAIARHAELGELQVLVDEGATLLFTENETNVRRLHGVTAPGPFKDAFHDAVVGGDASAVSAQGRGTKMAAHHVLRVPAGGSSVVRLRLARTSGPLVPADFDAVVALRAAEADRFHEPLAAHLADDDARSVQRQAYAGMLWSKQFYHLDIPLWREGDPLQPPPPPGRGRNLGWEHLNNADVISMPDTWEYPWYAAWDLAFHCVPLARLDARFAKDQLVLLTREWYMHPSGQMPAYEWAFGDVNPPVHAWAAWRVFEIDREQRGDGGDREFLERVFHKLMLNFTWWVNRKDAHGRNVFQGGFLGLDNIGVFDRNAPLPHGGHVNQADGTAWMAAYSLHLMRIALELARTNAAYEDIATKFFEHFLHIAEAMSDMSGGAGLWDEADGFFHDVLETEDGRHSRLGVRSMVGIIPLFAVDVLEPSLLAEVPGFAARLEWLLENRPALAQLVSRWQEPGVGERRLLSLLRGHRMKRILARVLDESEFLAPHGVRALSRHHLDHPYRFVDEHGDHVASVTYRPAESDSGVFGGNSNWRGPIWFPVNHLLVESLRRFHDYYGDDFRVECPAGSGRFLTLAGVADEIARRLASIFLRGEDGRRPVHGHCGPAQADPLFRDLVHFYEYFDGDTGRGVGASHQTGWTGLITELLRDAGSRHEGRALAAASQEAR